MKAGGLSAIAHTPAIAALDMTRTPAQYTRDGNPARAFCVQSVSIYSLEKYLHGIDLGYTAELNWRRVQPIKEVMENRYANDPDFVGAFPVSFFVDTMTTTIAFYPLFRDMDLGTGGELQVALRRDQDPYQHLTEFCTSLISSGLPLR